MKITPVTPTPPPVQSTLSNASAKRDAAIAKFMGEAPKVPGAAPNAQAYPVSNPSKISPEEASAVIPSTRQSSNSEADASATPEQALEAADTAPVAEPEAPKAEDPAAQHYAKLARQEKLLRQRAQESKAAEVALKAREDALAAKEAALRAKETQPESAETLRQKLKKDLVGTLKAEGYSYDQITQMMLDQPDPKAQEVHDTIAKLNAKIEQLEKAREDDVKTAGERQAESYQAALRQLKVEATALVSKDPAFETIKETGSVGDVVDLIEQTYKEDKILLSVEEAAKMVEDYLVEEAMKVTKIKKIQDRLAQSSKTEPTKQAEAAPKQQQPAKTLTNSQGSSRRLSPRERAMLAFEGKLNNNS